nr:hypothetical protein HmN_000288500 [Hymenolepis microstoma]
MRSSTDPLHTMSRSSTSNHMPPFSTHHLIAAVIAIVFKLYHHIQQIHLSQHIGCISSVSHMAALACATALSHTTTPNAIHTTTSYLLNMRGERVY